MTLGDFIISYRSDHSMSKRSFAEYVGLSDQYISMIEKGVNNFGQPLSPTMSTYTKIADAVGIPINDFLQMLSGNVTIGRSNNASHSAKNDFSLSSEEIELITNFRNADEQIREAAKMILRDSAEKNKKDEASFVS